MFLNHLEKYLNENKFIHHGAYAYNFFITGSKLSKIPVYNHEVYTQNYEVKDFNPMIKDLSKKFKDYTFKMQESIHYWKEVDVKDFILYGKKGKGNCGKLGCIYIQY